MRCRGQLGGGEPLQNNTMDDLQHTTRSPRGKEKRGGGCAAILDWGAANHI